MASEKKTSKNAAYNRLRAALKAQTTARAYLFYGEESYLRQTYVQQLQTLLIPKGSEDFNLHRLSGPRLTAQEVADAVEAMPMMALIERLALWAKCPAKSSVQSWLSGSSPFSTR